MDAGLDQNESELAVLVFAVALEVLAHGDSLIRVSAVLKTFSSHLSSATHLLDQHIEILWNLRSEACSSLCQSETKQRHSCFCVLCATSTHFACPSFSHIHTGSIIPLPLRIRRILLPTTLLVMSAKPPETDIPHQ